jgi:hypothetical protein
MAGGFAKTEEYMPSKHETLSLTLSTMKKYIDK